MEEDKMPNIEIHGAKDAPIGAEKLRDEIFQRTQNLPFAKEIWVTVIQNNCKDRYGEEQSFLRIVAKDDKIPPLVAALRFLSMNIEIIKLSKFIPRETLIK